MSRLAHVYVAVIFAVAGGCAGAAITLHWLAEGCLRCIPGGSE